MLWILLACTDDFKNVEQEINPLDTAEAIQDTSQPDDTDTAEEEVLEDLDGDGFTEDEGDCDDDDPSFNPNAEDDENDGLDQNCDGIADDGYVDPSSIDNDGDGWSESDGDCDDADININPDAIDECDGVDQNCDGVIDDGFLDVWEPNNSWNFGDTSAVNYLGQLDSGDGLIEIQTYLSPEADVDRFVFYNHDGIGWDFGFTVDVWDVPLTLDLQMNVEGFDEQGNSFGIVATASSNGPGTSLEMTYQGDNGNNTGYYVVTIAGAGSDCLNPYQIKFEED